LSARSNGSKSARAEMLAFIGGAVKSEKQGEWVVQTSISIRCLIKHLSFPNIITFDFPFYSILSDPNTVVPLGILYHIFGARAFVRMYGFM